MSYSDDLNKIFTDGSAFKGTINAGYGARIEYADNSYEEIYEPCGAHCSNYEAEAFAINAALEKIEETFKNEPNKIQDTVIFSDSLSCLESLKSQNFENSSNRDLTININSFLEDYNITLFIQWIPSHCNIPGNERADTLAKKGATKEQSSKPVSQATVVVFKTLLRRTTSIISQGPSSLSVSSHYPWNTLGGRDRSGDQSTTCWWLAVLLAGLPTASTAQHFVL